jgi:hypothetical protein
MYFQPTVTATRRFGRLGVDAFLGLNVNIARGKIYLDGDNSGAYLGFGGGGYVTTDWTGLRGGVGVSLLLK